MSDPARDDRTPYAAPAAPAPAPPAPAGAPGPGARVGGAPGRAAPGDEAGAALRAALTQAVRRSVVVCLGVGAVTAAVAGLLVGWPGVWGALVGIGIALAFLATTAVVGARTAGGDPLVVASWVLGSWLVKAVLVGVVLFLLKDATFYDPLAMFVGIVAGMVVTLFAEYRALTTARIPYVDTSGR